MSFYKSEQFGRPYYGSGAGPKPVGYDLSERISEGEANRLTPRVGMVYGWFEPFDVGGGFSPRVVFEAGPEYLFGHEVSTYELGHQDIQKVDFQASKWSTWSIKVGPEMRAFPEFLCNDDTGFGLGVSLGAYWSKNLNPITHRGDADFEINVGLAVTFY